MIYIEIPIWLAIIIVICMIIIMIYFIIADIFVRLLHNKYQLELKERERENKK